MNEATVKVDRAKFPSFAKAFMSHYIDKATDRKIFKVLTAAGKKIRLEKDPNSRKGYKVVIEKAVSQQQQKFMGMVRAYQKGEMPDASPEVKKAAQSMSKKDVKDFASTKHKGLPVKKEDLRKWFGKGPKGDWVRVGTDGEIKGDCAREPGEGKPKCMPRDKAHSMSKKDRGASARRKRRADPDVDRPGTGNKPIMVKTDKKKNESVNEAIDYMKVSKELDAYAKKHGGMDKREFEKAAAYVREIGRNSALSVQDKAGKGLNMLFKNADTDVRDRMQMILTKGGFKVKGGYVMRESVNEERLKVGDKVKTPQGTVEIKKRDTRAMRGKQDDYEMVLHMKNGKKASMGSHPAPTASAVTNIAKRHFSKGVPSYMKTESVNENFRTLARAGMGTEKKGEARVGLEMDYYDGSGTKRMGKITKVTAKGYIVKDDKDGKNRQFTFHDRTKAKEILARIGKGKYNESLEEKNVPTNPKLWSKFKSQAKSKFDVYPSAYANGWAAKQYKAAGGGWKTEALDPKQMAKAQKSASQKKSFKDLRKRMEDSDPCWDTHKQVGMKKKGGKMVPNCVPK